jgi:adenylate kinase family enzyme
MNTSVKNTHGPDYRQLKPPPLASAIKQRRPGLMETFFVAGSAEDPAFAEAELLGDLVVQSFPRVTLTKDMRHPCEWAEFRAKVCRLHGFHCPGVTILVWRRDGRLVGDLSDFRRVVKDMYNLEHEPDPDLIKAIVAENQAVIAKAAEADEWTPILGKVKKVWKDGISFEGNWKDHKPTKGVVTFPDGSTYEGGLKDGLFHGHGRRRFANGDKFVGKFVEGSREGSGRYEDAKGNVYDGTYSQESRGPRAGRPRTPCHGKGTRKWPNGRTYTGDWNNNEATGRGIESIPFKVESSEGQEPSFVDSKREYQGSFENGRYHGHGFMQYENGDSYDGAWVGGRREGAGIFVWSGKMMAFEGEFENDMPKYGLIRCEGSVNKQGEMTGKEIDFTTFYPGEFKLSDQDLPKWRSGLYQIVMEKEGWLDTVQERVAMTDMYDDFPIHDGHDHAMAQVLTRGMWVNLHQRITAGGITLQSCIAPGLDSKNTEHPLGLRASDPDCYIIFRELFDGVIRLAHKGFDPLTSLQPTDMEDEAAWQKVERFSPALMEIATSWKLQFNRNVGSLPCAAVISAEKRNEVERIVVDALLKMGQKDESLKGEYFPLENSESWPDKPGGMSSTEADRLRDLGVLFDEKDCSDTRDWPHARGVFITHDEKLVVHLNKEDHISYFCLGTPGVRALEFQEMFGLISLALASSEGLIFEDNQQEFARSENLGILLTSLQGIGTGMTVELNVRLPKLKRQQNLDLLESETGLTLTTIPIPEVGKKLPLQDKFALSVPQNLGVSEVGILNSLITGANELSKHEKTLALGRKKLWLVQEKPRILLLGAKEALADDITYASKLAEKFDLTLITPFEAVQAEIDKNTSLGQTAQWYRDAGKPVAREVVSKSIMSMVKSLESHHVRFANSGDAPGWVCSGFPASLEEVEMLVVTGMKPNKIISLKPDDASVQQVIDRRASRRRDRFEKTVFYLEDEPDRQAQDRGSVSPFEKLAEDRNTLPAEEARSYQAGYVQLRKALSKLAEVDEVNQEAEISSVMSRFISSVPGADPPLLILRPKQQLLSEKVSKVIH